MNLDSYSGTQGDWHGIAQFGYDAGDSYHIQFHWDWAVLDDGVRVTLSDQRVSYSMWAMVDGLQNANAPLPTWWILAF